MVIRVVIASVVVSETLEKSSRDITLNNEVPSWKRKWHLTNWTGIEK